MTWYFIALAIVIFVSLILGYHLGYSQRKQDRKHQARLNALFTTASGWRSDVCLEGKHEDCPAQCQCPCHKTETGSEH